MSPRSRLPCHPPSWLGSASHTCVHYRRPQQLTYLTYVAPSLPGRQCANGQLARKSRAWSACRSRLALAVYRPRSRFHHQQMGVVFQLPVTDLQSLDELEKSLQQSCIMSLRLKAIGIREYGLHCTAELEWLIVSID
jgi:hypothetical protein